MKLNLRSFQWLSNCECSIICDVEYWGWDWTRMIPFPEMHHYMEYRGSHGIWNEYTYHLKGRPPKKIERALAKIFDQELTKKMGH